MSAPNKRCLCRSYPPELCKLLGTVIRYCGLPKNFLNLLAKFNQKQWDIILGWFSFLWWLQYTDWNFLPAKKLELRRKFEDTHKIFIKPLADNYRTLHQEWCVRTVIHTALKPMINWNKPLQGMAPTECLPNACLLTCLPAC